MIVDASVVIDAVGDPGPRGAAARAELAAQPATESLIAPGHFAFEVLSGLHAASKRPGYPLAEAEIDDVLADAEALSVEIEGTPWADVRRAWELSRHSLRFADALYVAAAERHGTALITADARIARSGAPIRCRIITVVPEPDTAG